MQRTTRRSTTSKAATRGDDAAAPFWKRKSLGEMTAVEWESLCDGCGRCCMLKLEDEDTGGIYLTQLACRLLDTTTCRCSDYAARHQRVPDCISLDPNEAKNLSWLPETCGYRRVAEGRDLDWWHPLVSGDPETVHAAGISVQSWARPETEVGPLDLADFIVDGYGGGKPTSVHDVIPLNAPRGGRRP